MRVVRHRRVATSATPVRLLRSAALASSWPRLQQHARRFMTDGGLNDNDGGGGGGGDDAGGVSGGVSLPRSALPPSDFPERSFLKCIEKEMQDEALRLDKEEGAPPPPSGWEMYHAPGTSVFYGRRWWLPPTPVAPAGPRGMERHTIRVQLTTRDPSLDPECDVRGEHFPFSLFVQRGVGGAGGVAEERGLYEQSIEVRADFVEGELVVDHVVFHGTHAPAAMASSPARPHSQKAEPHNAGSTASPPALTEAEVQYNNLFGGYPGPNLDEVEEEVLDGIQAWLAERCIDDQFGEFVGQYSVWVEQMEYERWLRQLRDFVAA
ncbi:putative mitochondrial glycoprotein [Trypanosoma conorhini]|uniref:Putative mitochondrial glycoprotein n=1 Tax=Trypanosoma conorhini TaxID=83891 RepID=A0A422PEK5_9TRYP|nr:putative mitochondrial glycoprotein [Trypanosoma conorhini]RNF16134.1 putative mitochondrial glycoprotein [Trypanosoma conorhini]